MNNLLPQTLQQPFHGILFDLDGTLLDSEAVHYTAFREAMKEFGYDFDAITKNIPYQGSFKRLFQDIQGNVKISEDEFNAIYERKVEYTLQISPMDIDKVEGVLSFLEVMLDRNIPMGVVTNSEREYADYILQGHDLQHYFQHVITSSDLTKPKPNPEGYLRGAELLGILPSKILVFENNDAGITAAKAAGMPVVAIQTTDAQGFSKYEAADLAIDHFGDPFINDLVFTV